jgi:hypothetical protein
MQGGTRHLPWESLTDLPTRPFRDSRSKNHGAYAPLRDKSRLVRFQQVLTNGLGLSLSYCFPKSVLAAINETIAKKFWRNADPLKDRIVIGRGVAKEFDTGPPRQIIGVVSDARDEGLSN